MSETIMLEAIVKRLPELSQLFIKKADAALVFTNACKAAAQAAHVDVGVLKAYVAAITDDDKLAAKKDKAEQLSFLFTEIPE